MMSTPTEVEHSNSDLTMELADNDLSLSLEELNAKIKELEREKKEMCDKFDTQRGKLQKLYLQKEEELRDVKNNEIKLETEVERLKKELDEAKSQITIADIVKESEVEAEKQKAQAQIATLNQIVNESVEVSTISQTEVNKLKQVIKVLEAQVTKLRGEKEKEGILLASSNVILGAKFLAKKVVGQLGNDSDYRSQDNLEDSMKKAQEDAEVLRSLVIPLENRIRELSEKLAASEEKLKKYEPVEGFRKTSPSEAGKNEKNLIDLSSGTSQEREAVSPNDSRSPLKEESDLFSVDSYVSAQSPSANVSCDMCVNYEGQLVSQQQLTRQLEKQKELLETNIEKIKEDLIKETNFRKCMEDKWNAKKEEHKVQVSKLKSLYENAEEELKNLRRDFEEVKEEVKKDLYNLRYDREKINSELEQLQRENDNLLGKYSAHSEQLRDESINFPDNVDDLHELLLKSHEELIEAKVAKEAKEELVDTLKCEIQILREQMNNDLKSKNEMENNLALTNSSLREELESKNKELESLQRQIDKIKGGDKKNDEIIRRLEQHVEVLTKEKRLFEQNISELRSRVGSLQQELDTSETVQKDFVRLSQSLQIELEKIRGADKEVRWQHEEDVIECLGCKSVFGSIRKKAHCRHCGKIFCFSCLAHIINSGPNDRPSHVCQVCHTLLNRETAPYFSQEPPHSPD